MALLGGCLAPGVTRCDDLICPGGTVCDEVNGGCVLPEQLTACTDLQPGDPCDIAGDAIGICKGGVCVRAGCGDGFVRGAERCDGPLPDNQDDCTDHGFHLPGLVTCASDCTFDTSACSTFCGDGVAGGGEDCDPPDLGGLDCRNFGFYDQAGLDCSLACTFDLSGCSRRCGDGTVDPEESCEPGVALALDCTDLVRQGSPQQIAFE
jgi:hypothetical protein